MALLGFCVPLESLIIEAILCNTEYVRVKMQRNRFMAFSFFLMFTEKFLNIYQSKQLRVLFNPIHECRFDISYCFIKYYLVLIIN